MKPKESPEQIKQDKPFKMKAIKLRFAIITFLLLMAVLMIPILGLNSLLPPVLLIICAAFFSNLIWTVWGKRVKHRAYFATFIDVFLITAAIHYIGGIETPFAWIYAIVLISIGALRGVRVSMFGAALSSLMYSSLLLAEFDGVIPHVSLDVLNPEYLHQDKFYLYIKLLSANVLFFITAAVSGVLSERLVRYRNRLEAGKKDLEKGNEQLRLEVAERKHAEEALRKSEEKYRGLFESSIEGIFTVDSKGNFTSSNRATDEILGYPGERLIGTNYREYIVPEQRETLFQEFNKLFRAGEPIRNIQYDIIRGDDERRTIEGNVTLILENEQQVGFQVTARDITDRKRAKEALSASEERYRMVVEEANDIICTVDMKTGIITSANSFAERLLGYKYEEVANKLNFIELIHPDDHESLFGRLHELAQEKNRKPNFPARLLRADGEVIDAEINGNVINDSDGNPETFVGVIRDVTERKMVESALRESEQRYRTVVDNSLTGIFIIQDGEYKFVNERLCDMAGYSQEELLKMTFMQIIHPDDVELAREALTKRLSDENSEEHFQLRAVAKNGDIGWIETLGTEVEFQGRPAVLVNVIDITDRKKAEDEKRWSEDRYRSLFEESKDCVFVSTPDGMFLDINAAGVEMYGYSSKDELLKVDIVHDLYTDPGQRKVIEKILAEKGYVKDYEFTYKRKDGRVINVLETVTTVRDENGDIVAYRGIQRDITEQKQLQEQLLQAQKMESIGTLAGGIAHDFNNLLGGILGYASLMKTKLPEGHQVYQYADTVEKSATRAAELTAQLLAFARGGKYEMRIIDLNAIVNETLGIIGRTFDKSIEIETYLDEQLPTIEADAGQIQQVLMNLCVNGRDAMNGHGRLIIETKVETITEEYIRAHMNAVMGSCVVLSVTDTGSGMNEETIERIFEPFFTTKPEGEGTGLGLSMVYGVVKNHDGYVRVYSEPGEGSTFKVYLPVDGKPKAKEKQERGAIDNGSGLVLVVDDEASIRSLARDILESYGYDVLLAEDGPEAIKLYSERGNEIDLVILDMVMPKMNGRETFAKLKDLNPSVKALLSTGYSQNGKAKGILESGVMGFVQKPYNVNALLSEVKSVLHRKL